MQSDRTERLNVHAHPLTVRAHGELFKIQKEKEVSQQNISLSYLILSYLILSYLILSYLILSYLILSYLILFIYNLHTKKVSK